MLSNRKHALSVVKLKSISADVVAREKANTIKKNGVLEIIDVQESLDNIGGLDVLKDWLIKRKTALNKAAREYGLPVPKGLLIIGIPGTGKSLTAKATASVFKRPLLKLDAGRLFGSLVGQSEGNLRSVIQTAEAIAPCVLWIGVSRDAPFYVFNARNFTGHFFTGFVNCCVSELSRLRLYNNGPRVGAVGNVCPRFKEMSEDCGVSAGKPHVGGAFFWCQDVVEN